jgi:hypothetical protein
MYKTYEIDYNNRTYLLGTFETLKEAVTAERKALKKSHGEFPTFTSDGKNCLTNNGKVLAPASKV